MKRRRFQKKKPAYKHKKKSAPKLFSTREVKHIETTSDSKNIAFIAEGPTQMANGAILYPVGFNSTNHHVVQGVGVSNVIGAFLRPLYLSQKFKISFAGLDLDKAVVNSGLKLRCRSGWVRNTGAKCGASLATDSAAWQQLINVMVHKELQAADMDADYLQYTRKSRNIMIVKDTFLKPRLNQRMGTDDAGANVHAQNSYAPEICFTINWDKTKGFLRNKTRLEPTGSHATQLVLHNQFIPFVYFSCEQFTNTDEGHIEVKSSSRYYFTDA
jgi:hypothetical protein